MACPDKKDGGAAGTLKTVKESGKVPLSKMVSIPPKPYPSANIEYDNITLLNNYLPSASTLEIVERFSAGMRGAKSGRMLSITGPYGSGKSSMATFLAGLLAPKKSKEWKAAYAILKKEPNSYGNTLVYARKKANIHKDGMIRCMVTARREPITATLLRALDTGLEKYLETCTSKNPPSTVLLKRWMRNMTNGKLPDSAELIKTIEDVARSSPVVIMIDEFGKNIEYFATDESQQSDLFLLQELAERAGKGRSIPLSIVTLQHMAFEEYAVGTSATQKKEWAKIQGRFEDIPFANSPDQTRMLVSGTIKSVGDTERQREVLEWAKRESKAMQDMGIGTGSSPDLIAFCYPLSPLALEVLPELCSRYGQHERTLLSFLSDSRRYTVAAFIDENIWNVKDPPVMGLDALYDYFISGTSMIHSSSANVSRLMEVETIIRDAHGLSDVEKRALKTIGMLNLIGRSGYLRASRRLIDYSIGKNSRRILDSLVKRSMITYRKHADEYRIWHGTDIDVAAKMDMYRKRYQRTSLATLLEEAIRLEPVVAAKHSIRTGTMRLFGRRFTLKPIREEDKSHDGIILYLTDDSKAQQYEKPLVTVTPRDTTELRFAAIEVCAIRDILNSDDNVVSDWVARREFEERLVDAEVVLDRRFADAYGDAAEWSYGKGRKSTRMHGGSSVVASRACDARYCHTPIIRNEMINRNLLSTQGSTAKKRLLEAMITHMDKPRFGLDGHGPERAIYEAVIYENQIHVQDTLDKWKLRDPMKNSMTPVWDSMLDAIKQARGRIVLTDVYKIAKMPPYGVRDGPVQLLAVAMMLIHRDAMALYEHGTFVPKLQPEVAERMTKNPEHFELKYLDKTPSKVTLLKHVSTGLKTDSNVLAIVSYLVRTISSLPSHIKHTKNLDEKTMAVRNAVLNATEPDTLLFESLPNALGFKKSMSSTDTRKFARDLVKTTNVLQNAFSDMLEDIVVLLFNTTGIDERFELSKAAKVMAPDVSDQDMKVFLNSLSADMLEDTEDWIKYVAMSLTNTPPDDWGDDHRYMFENKLHDISSKFKRLAGIHFAKVSDSFAKPSYQVTVTHSDGSEHRNVVSLNPKQKEKIERIAILVKKEIKKNKLTKNDLSALVAMLGLESEQ